MPRKSLEEMNDLERLHYSLSSRMFHTILLFSLILSIAAGAFGFYLYSAKVSEDYSSRAYSTAGVAALAAEREGALNYVPEVLNIYLSLSEEETGQKEEENYHERFRSIEEAVMPIRETLYRIQKENGSSAVYLAVYDKETGRLIYVIDSDRSDLYCFPGYWDEIGTRESARFLDQPYADDFRTYVPHYTEKDPKYGYLCTSWNLLEEDERFLTLIMADMDLSALTAEYRVYLLQYITFLLLLTLLLDYLIVRRMKKTVVGPITDISKAAEGYLIDKQDGHIDERHFADLNIRTGDEIEGLALTMKEMETEMAHYIEDLTKVTAEKEKLGVELDIAGKIQTGMIPRIFPPYPDRPEFDLYASMRTAKEVGGDFYDFYMQDDDHLVLVIADVSGKGIPGALFMMASKIMISNVISLGERDPAKVLQAVNEQICRNNPAEMFVTVWLGILEISSGILRACNGGHEYPCLKRNGKDYELFRDKHGLVLGGMESSRYASYEIRMERGDSLFVYTDGVTEAANKDNELVGTGRMLEELNKDPQRCCEDLLRDLQEAIDAFAGEADQFDDITMLGLTYKGEQNEMTLDATIENIPVVTEFVDRKLEELDCPVKAQMQIDVAIDELFSNIAKYAYHPDTGPATVRIDVEEDPLAVVITFIDQGIPYDPLKADDPDVTLDAEQREIGGLGIFLVRKTMDDVSYEYKDGRNILCIRKNIG